MSTVFLKVKIKSLAAEAKIIRHEEEKRKGPYVLTPRTNTQQQAQRYRRQPLDYNDIYFELRGHRTWIVRNEARATQLAYAYIRGRRYRQIEAKTHDNVVNEYLLPRIVDMVRKYGFPTLSKDVVLAHLRDWLDDRDVPIKIAA